MGAGKGPMRGPQAGYPVRVGFDTALTAFLRPGHRTGLVEVAYDGTSSLGHVVESLGVPLPEVGELLVGGRPAQPSVRIPPGEDVRIRAVVRPQWLRHPPRFCADVHLGALARRLRLLGLDTWYRNSSDDDELIAVAREQGRMLLTQDRALLRRRAVAQGAYVRGTRPDDQLMDVLDRFAPVLAPWTRCPACNGPLAPVPKSGIEDRLQPGTRRTYDTFAQCRDCGRPYWHGAHARRLDALVARARRAAGRR